jgi:hypothetical protein
LLIGIAAIVMGGLHLQSLASVDSAKFHRIANGDDLKDVINIMGGPPTTRAAIADMPGCEFCEWVGIHGSVRMFVNADSRVFVKAFWDEHYVTRLWNQFEGWCNNLLPFSQMPSGYPK